MVIAWNTGLAAERARFNLKLKKKKAAGPKRQATSSKRQASSLTRNNNRIIKD